MNTPSLFYGLPGICDYEDFISSVDNIKYRLLKYLKKLGRSYIIGDVEDLANELNRIYGEGSTINSILVYEQALAMSS